MLSWHTCWKARALRKNGLDVQLEGSVTLTTGAPLVPRPGLTRTTRVTRWTNIARHCVCSKMCLCDWAVESGREDGPSEVSYGTCSSTAQMTSLTEAQAAQEAQARFLLRLA